MKEWSGMPIWTVSTVTAERMVKVDRAAVRVYRTLYGEIRYIVEARSVKQKTPAAFFAASADNLPEANGRRPQPSIKIPALCADKTRAGTSPGQEQFCRGPAEVYYEWYPVSREYDNPGDALARCQEIEQEIEKARAAETQRRAEIESRYGK